MTTQYPLVAQGIFRTIQGEGALVGLPMTFLRLGGCSVGCPDCDTDYRVHERQSAAEIRARVLALGAPLDWIWITGGEPADHDLDELLETLLPCGKLALATSGSKTLHGAGRWLEFISVSPHGKPDDLVLLPWKPHHVHRRTQINLVPGLNGLRLADWEAFDASGFEYRYVTPLWYAPSERAERTDECLAWIGRHPGWRLGIQAHRVWGLP